jgi:hypothetical protein
VSLSIDISINAFIFEGQCSLLYLCVEDGFEEVGDHTDDEEVPALGKPGFVFAEAGWFVEDFLLFLQAVAD